MTYAIFVQNGYFIFDEIIQGNKSDLCALREVYQSSAMILSISEDTARCIEQAFDISKENILIVTPSINQEIFTYKNTIKENIITYMPRKLPSHANYVINHLLLKNYPNWRILPIEGVNETDVARHLSLSKIFLSFSDREGLSLPPLEAAFCGNSVIGYTGEGAKEYWRNDLFQEVNCGNLLEFIKLVEQEIAKFDHPKFYDTTWIEKSKLIENLKDKYSAKREAESLKYFISKIQTHPS